jgi:hypothetical protein
VGVKHALVHVFTFGDLSEEEPKGNHH